MRLINTRTLRLKVFNWPDIPQYAILSHTWESEEVTLQQFIAATSDRPSDRNRLGFRKIERFCQEALKDGFEWAWADTCSINKADPTELSEAINSMYAWYKISGRCYVFLSDYKDLGSRKVPASKLEASLQRCRWFTRGWTLQEMIAPRHLLFFDQSWQYVGSRAYLARAISKITNISVELLQGTKNLHDFSCAQKLSWAAGRQTTRLEDRTYSLLGIFEITLSLIYGEGLGAFQRLQEEIMKRSADQSLFAWTLEGGQEFQSPNSLRELNPYTILAPSPDCFRGSSNIVPYNAESWRRFWLRYLDEYCRPSRLYADRCLGAEKEIEIEVAQPYMMTNMGLEIAFTAVEVMQLHGRSLQEAALYCYDQSNPKAGPRTICLVENVADGEIHRAEPFYLGYAMDHGPHRHHHWLTETFVIQTTRMNQESWGDKYYTEDLEILMNWKRRAESRVQKARVRDEELADKDDREERNKQERRRLREQTAARRAETRRKFIEVATSLVTAVGMIFFSLGSKGQHG